MGPISVTAEAGFDILRRIASGSLEIHGILLRDSDGKKFRYILRGVEDLSRAGARVTDLPPLDPLRSAMNLTQILQIVSVAQNAAVAASLRRIEAVLAEMERRLDGIDRRLQSVETKQILILDTMRAAPVSRLKAAKTAAIIALSHGDRTALIAAGKDAQQASHDLLEQAKHLVRVEEDGLPVALLTPRAHADLAESAAEAAVAASAIWLSLDGPIAAANLMHETADSIDTMRRKLATALGDPELLLRRIRADRGRDADLILSGQRLRDTMLWSRARGVLIDQGLITSDPERLEFELIQPACGLAFVPIDDRSDAPSGADSR